MWLLSIVITSLLVWRETSASCKTLNSRLMIWNISSESVNKSNCYRWKSNFPIQTFAETMNEIKELWKHEFLVLRGFCISPVSKMTCLLLYINYMLKRSFMNNFFLSYMCKGREAVAMEPAWRQQGRGRGRGQNGQGDRPCLLQMDRPDGQEQQGQTKVTTVPGPQCGEDLSWTAVSWPRVSWQLIGSLCATGELVQSKFEEIRKSDQAAAQRLVENYISSSSSDDDDHGDVDHEDEKRGKILVSTFTTYASQTGESRKNWNSSSLEHFPFLYLERIVSIRAGLGLGLSGLIPEIGYANGCPCMSRWWCHRSGQDWSVCQWAVSVWSAHLSDLYCLGQEDSAGKILCLSLPLAPSVPPPSL